MHARGRRALDEAVSREDWTAASAAAHLVRVTGGDPHALRVLRAQLGRAAPQSQRDARAVRTLDLALSVSPPGSDPGSVPRQRSR